MPDVLPSTIVLGPVRLVVRDLQRSCDFYEHVLGMRVAQQERNHAVLSFGLDEPIIELESRPESPLMGRRCGLYHVALLYPDRPALAEAVARIMQRRTAVQGVADHHTHEAVYLADPDGNGLELACDWPASMWPALESIDAVRPDPLDIDDLMAQRPAGAVSLRADPGVRVGHLHLHVADIAVAEEFYCNVIGLHRVMGIDSASFLAAGSYHHHLAVNTWNGTGVADVDPDAVGLASWSIYVPDSASFSAFMNRLLVNEIEPESASADRCVVLDPFGNRLEVMVR